MSTLVEKERGRRPPPRVAACARCPPRAQARARQTNYLNKFLNKFFNTYLNKFLNKFALKKFGCLPRCLVIEGRHLRGASQQQAARA